MTEIDDIQSFIAAQKKRIQQERSELVFNNRGRNSVSRNPSRQVDAQRPDSPKITQENNTHVQRPVQPKATIQETSPRGLSFGEYESVQERLKKERAEEYKKFLARKNYRSTGVKSSDTAVEKSALKSALHVRKAENVDDYSRDLQRDDVTSFNTKRNAQQDSHSNGTPREPYRPRGREKTYNELYDAYEELLERKRQDERRYRGLIDDPYSDPRRVRFDEESRLGKLYADTWLDKGQRRRWVNDQADIGRQDDRKGRDLEDRPSKAYDDTQKKSVSIKNETPDRVSRSAPSQAIPLFGEHDVTPEVKQERQAKYREELQAQMKEREMQKKREKNHVFTADQTKEETERSLPPNPQGYNSGLSRPQENLVQPPQGVLNQPYYNPYLQAQAYNYPAGMLAAGGGSLVPSLNPGRLPGGYPMSSRELVGGYQPSWANALVQPQRLGDVRPGLAETEARSMDSRLGHTVSGIGVSKYGDFGEHVGVLPYHETKKDVDRDRQQSYREELTRQMAEKEMRKRKDREAAERYQMKLEKEIQEYDPWGKSGGGAPIKDVSGKLVSDLRQMHQYNKEGTIISPRDREAKPEVYLDKENSPSSYEKPSSTVHYGTLLNSDRPAIETDDPQKKAKLEYQEYLRQQVEEKQRKKKEEEDRLKEIDARQDKIILEQQMKLKDEYDKELENVRKKEEAARVKNDEIRLAAEKKKKEIEEKRLEDDRKQEEKLRKQLDERLKAATGKQSVPTSDSPPPPTLQDQHRSNSPPIPTLQGKSSPPVPALQNQPRSNSPPIPTLQNQPRAESPPIPTLQQNKNTERPVSRGNIQRQTSFERETSRPSSNTGRARRQRTPSAPSTPKNQTNQETSRHRVPSATADIDVLSQLTSLRRQLKNEEIKVQQQLNENQEKFVQLSENNNTRRNKKPVMDVFDNVLRRTPAATQRNHDTKAFGAIEEFNKLKYEDTSSLHGDFISQYPDPATSGSTLELQQQSLIKEQQRRLQVFRDRLMASDKENVESLSNRTRPNSKTSQLESDSQFVSVEDPTKVLLGHGESLKQPPRIPSARERRRWKQMEQLVKNTKLNGIKPPTPGGSSLNSVTSFNVDEIAQKNEERLRRLETMKQARSESKSDPNEVLKKFIEKHSRPDSKISEASLPADKHHIPNT